MNLVSFDIHVELNGVGGAVVSSLGSFWGKDGPRLEYAPDLVERARPGRGGGRRKEGVERKLVDRMEGLL